MLFVVGNSRSGTTMMSRVLARHPDVRRLRELHFFDRYWSPKRAGESLSEREARRIARELCALDRGGSRDCAAEARRLVADLDEDERTAIGVFRAFLLDRAAERGGSIPCEQTGRNVFYLSEILASFPGARVIDMVRDPRDVLLSQKRKWRSSRARSRPIGVTLQEITNYHAVTMARLWAAAVRMGDRFEDDPRVLVVRFEELLTDPESVVRTIYSHCGLDYRPEALAVPNVGSSTAPRRPDVLGIDATRAGNWRRGGLNDTEVWLCQRLAGREMRTHGYQMADVRPDPILLAYYLFSLPFKSGLALLNNARGMASAGQAIARRLSA